jgi:amino acid adenylation domain-containing protein
MLDREWSEKENGSVQTIWRAEIEDILPLCPLQESLLFHLVYDPDVADIYISQTIVGLKGALDENILKRAAAFLLDRHSSLRASFEFEGISQPVQLIPVQVPLVWSRDELIDVPPAEKEEKLRDILAEDLKQPFTPARPPLVRFKLIQLTPDEYRFVITSHHILFDGWSAMILLKELLTAYSQNGNPIDLPPPTPYREYLSWLSRQDRDRAAQEWREALAGLKEGTCLAPRLARQSAPVHERLIEFLPEDLTLALVDSARNYGVTLNAMIQTAWALLLGSMTHRTNVVFGGTVSGRPPSIEGIESMVGLFVETLPIRVEFRSTDRLIDLVRDVHKRQSRLMDYHYIGLTEIQRVAGLTQLFDTIIIFQNYPVTRNFLAELASGLYVTSIQGRDDSHYPLSVMVVPGRRLELSFSYRVDAFSHSTIRTITGQLVELLKGFLGQPEAPVGTIHSDMQAPANHILEGQPCDMPDVSGLAELVEVQASRVPDRIAVVDGEQSLTYDEVNQQANCLAHYLIDLGIGPEDMVTVILDRSINAVLALLACLKCGAAYVPIDSDYPPERIKRILQQARPKVVLCASARRSEVEGHPVCALDERDVMQEIQAKPRFDPRQHDRVLPLNLNHPIYVIFTSGTTGTPKGVVMRAGAILNLLTWHCRQTHEASVTRIAQFTSLGFDVSVQEILYSMSTGKMLHIVPAAVRYDPEEFVRWLDRNDINLFFSPSLVIGAVCAAAADGNIELKALTDVIQGGEPLVITGAVRRQFASRALAKRLHNHYGPSETHAVTAYRLPASTADWPARVPIGQPITNVKMYVLNESLAPVRPGESGELYIAGAALARGYLNNPTLTAERFVADPFGAPGDRMYRTGDLVSVNQERMLEFIGRIDNQVKIGGVRIEPGEVETALLRIEGIVQCAVLVVDNAGKKQLAAYIVWSENRKSDISEIRQQLRHILPEYMVPHRYCFIDKLPLTCNGKLNKESLLALLKEQEQRSPQSKEEKILCELYAEVLQTTPVGPEDDFFALGGDSLLATRLIGRIRSTTRAELSIRHLFEFPRICELARLLEQQREEQKA